MSLTLNLKILAFSFGQLGFDVKECKETNATKENEHIGAKFHLDNGKELSNEIGTNPADNTRNS